jgi:hypothetical protein
MEQLFERFRPDVLVPEVGNETMRTAAALVAQDRDVATFFLFHSIFPNPLRICVNSMRAPLAGREDIRPLTRDEEQEVERFMADFKGRAAPIREYRSVPITGKRLRIIARHVAVKLLFDQDNEYLRPGHWVARDVREVVRTRAAGRYYDPVPTERPYVYFPLHLGDDTKLKRLIPHCADQPAIVEQVARALPHGYDLVVKEHPLSIGRNSLATLRKLRRMRTVRLVPPRTSSRDLIRDARAIVVISSSVGLEALLHEKPVLTIGRPFYSGYGVTMDIESFGDIREAVPAVLSMTPDPARIRQVLHAGMREGYPGMPVLVNRSQENALELAGSLELAARRLSSEHEAGADATPQPVPLLRTKRA